MKNYIKEDNDINESSYLTLRSLTKQCAVEPPLMVDDMFLVAEAVINRVKFVSNYLLDRSLRDAIIPLHSICKQHAILFEHIFIQLKECLDNVTLGILKLHGGVYSILEEKNELADQTKNLAKIVSLMSNINDDNAEDNLSRVEINKEKRYQDERIKDIGTLCVQEGGESLYCVNENDSGDNDSFKDEYTININDSDDNTTKGSNQDDILNEDLRNENELNNIRGLSFSYHKTFQDDEEDDIDYKTSFHDDDDDARNNKLKKNSLITDNEWRLKMMNLIDQEIIDVNGANIIDSNNNTNKSTNYNRRNTTNTINNSSKSSIIDTAYIKSKDDDDDDDFNFCIQQEKYNELKLIESKTITSVAYSLVVEYISGFQTSINSKILKIKMIICRFMFNNKGKLF
jgi:hypothetical protein